MVHPLVSVGLGIFDLWRDSRGTPTVTPRLVIELSSDVCVITYGAIMYIVLVIWQAVRDSGRLLQQHHSTFDESIELQKVQNLALKSLLMDKAARQEREALG